MLSAYSDPHGRRIRAFRDGPPGALFEAFTQTLFEAHYPTITARLHLRAAEHFIHWTHRNGVSVPELNEQALVRFGGHLQ